MRWGLLATRLAIVAANLTILAIILLSTVPLALGGLDVRMPDSGMPEPTIEEGVVTMSVPLEVYNGGYFDIEDFRLFVRITEGGEVLAEEGSAPADIKAGRYNDLDLSFTMDLNAMDPEVLSILVFEEAILDMRVGVEASYSLGLVRAEMSFNQTMTWEPLISGLDIRSSDATVVINGTSLDILVPYRFEASEMVHGQTVQVHATLRNATTQLGEGEETIVLQQVNEGELRFTVSPAAALWLMTHSEVLTIGLDITYAGVTMHQDHPYDWEGML